MNDIRSIDTFYNNNYFRSRLEARWAVFFDELKIKYLYEPEGFILPDGSKYLPDFWLPQFECYAEVKPDDKGYYNSKDSEVWFNEDLLKAHPDFKKWIQVGRPILLLIGNPHCMAMPLLNEYQCEICDASFYKDLHNEDLKGSNYWRFWIGAGGYRGQGDYQDGNDNYSEAAEIANKKRFEFN